MNEIEQYRYEQAKEWLEHVARLKHAADAARDMMEMFWAIAENVKAIDYSREHVSGSPEMKRLEDSIAKVEDAAAQWAANQSAFVHEAVDAAERISRLDDAVERRALLLHYVDGKTWEHVCVQMDYSWQRMMEIRKSAVLHVYEFVPTQWRDPVHMAL